MLGEIAKVLLKKRILIYGINYSPELTGIGKYSGELADFFHASGWEVRVITAPPYYPDWKVWPAFRASRYLIEDKNGLKVYRAPLWVPQRPSGIKRIIHLLSFALSSLPLLVMNLRWKPSVVFVVEPPLFCSFNAIAFSKMTGAFSWLHIQDFEVDAAFQLGLIKNPLAKRFATAIEKYLMSRFDLVSTISRRMLALASRKGVNNKRLVFFPNWVDIAAIKPSHSYTKYRKDLCISENDFVALYSGNMGAKQGLDVIGFAAQELMSRSSSEKTVHFIFCGNGASRMELEEMLRGTANVHFLDLQPVDSLSELLATADVHLLPQRSDAADLVMPSKLTGMLSSGRATIATAVEGTEIAQILAEHACGVVVPPGDAHGIVAAILELANDSYKCAELGKNARAYAMANLSQEAILESIEREISNAIKLRGKDA